MLIPAPGLIDSPPMPPIPPIPLIPLPMLPNGELPNGELFPPILPNPPFMKLSLPMPDPMEENGFPMLIPPKGDDPPNPLLMPSNGELIIPIPD